MCCVCGVCVLREMLGTYGALHEGLGGEEERLFGILGDGIVGDGLNVAVDRDHALLQLPGRAQHLLLHLLVQLAPHRRLLRSCQRPRRSSSEDVSAHATLKRGRKRGRGGVYRGPRGTSWRAAGRPY